MVDWTTLFLCLCVCMYVCDFVFQCAVTCGHGYQMRAVRCVSGDYGDTVDDRECNAAARPRDSQVKKKCSHISNYSNNQKFNIQSSDLLVPESVVCSWGKEIKCKS